MVDMEGNPKLEGGEARYFKGDEDKNIDPDIALSYIDEKIQNVLGHFQKDFEGGVSAEHLGAKFGGYGSFLPAYERSPSILSRPNSPQRNYNVSRSNNLPIEGASQNLKAPPNTAPPSRLGITSCSAHQLHKSRILSMDVSLKQSQVSEMSPLKDETLNRLGNPTDQRPLKVRIKMGSDNSGRGNAAIYSGLGLDYSPSSSPGNSLEESEGVSPTSQGTFDNSPASIIQEMTSFTIPGGVLISPLHDSLLWLMRKEKVYSIGRPILPLKGHQEHSAMLVDESHSIMGNGKVFKEKRTKSMKRDRLVKLKYGSTVLDDTALEMKKISVNETIEAKELLIGDLKCTHISKSVKEAGGASELLRESNKDGGKSKLLASELVKEESSESISGQEHGKSQKRNPRSSLVENVCGNRVVNSHKDVLIDCKDVSSGQKISASSKSCSDESKCKEEPNPQKNKIGWKATFREDDEVNLPFKTEELSFEGKKKSKGIRSNGKPVNFSVNESLRPGESAEPSNKRSTGYGGIVCNSKVQRKTSQKDYKGKDSRNDSLLLTNLKEKDNRMDPVERPGGDRKKDANLGAFELQRNVFLDKGKGRSSGKKIDKQSIYGPSIKDASTACPITENGLASEMVPPMAVPVVIEEDWVQCDRCQKWRLLPFGTKPDQLPDKWLCSMLNWLHGMNHCDISEEETTKALNALYQLPVPESQNNLQNHVTGTTLGVSFGDKQHLDENNQNLSSHPISNRGKKKPGFKEKANAGTVGGPFQVSNSTKIKLQESEKSRSLNDSNQHLAEANPTKKSSYQHLSVLHNLVAEKDMPSQREKPINGGGDVRQIKMKSKREADEYGCGTSKKSKTEDMHADKHKTLKMGRGRVQISSSSFLPTMGSGNVIQKYDGFLPEGTKCEVNDKVVASVKKLGDKARVSSDGGSLEMRMSSKKDMSLKKRKLKDQEISKNKIETFPNSAPDGRVYEKEERSERGSRKEKKFRFSNTEVESRPNDTTDKLNKKDGMSGIFSSDIRDHPVDGMEEARRNDKDQQLRKHKKKIVSERTTDVVSLRRDLGSGQVSMAANSSSSKVSGSSKTRANIEEVRGSPVESVSSSPLRTFNLDKLTSAGGDIAGKDDAMNSVPPVMGDFRRCSDGERNAEINLPETVICLEPLKFSALECMDGDANHQLSGKANPSPDTRNSHLPNGDVDMVEQNVRFLSDLRAPERSRDEDRGKKNCHDKAVLQKADKGTGLRSRGKSRSSISEFDGDKIKISDPVNEYTKKSQRIDLEIDSNHRVPVHETTADVKHSFPKKTSIKFRKDEKNHARKRDPVGQWSSESRMVTKLKEKGPDGLDMKPGAQCRSNGKLAPQHGLIQDFEGENKADLTQMKQRVGKSKFSLSFGEGKLEKVSLGCAPVPGPQKLNGAIHAPGDVSKTSKDSGKVDNANRVNLSLGNLQPDRQGVRDLKASSPGRLISSSQTATNTLKEAKDLRDTADRLKSSCFGFESNEAYFQAGLKFLHGALLLDNCNGEGGRNEEMNPIQAYGTAAKLCELCALQYEARQEMAAAALAYKCSEVAYMKVVYCKHSSLNRDRHELQATLHVVPQGESPSSSASDVDNLNNLATVDKGNLSKGTGSYVAGNQIIVARNRPQFVRLLDFTQDVVFALEASRKSQEAFAAANVILEEEQNKDCVTSVKRVIDFSFEDIEELVRLVRIAMEAISCSGFGAARD